MLIKQLNFKNLNKGFFKKAALALIALAFLTAYGCGKKAPPQPPVERVRQRVQISGSQKGNVITLSWIMPARNEKEGGLLNVSRIDIYRLAEPLNSSLTLTEEDFADRSTLINSIPISTDDFALKQLTYQDKLDFAGQEVRLRYAIRFVNASGQKAAFSNFLQIEPTAKVASPPSLLKVKKFEEEAILLEWTAPKDNIDGSKPANILGYNVYRKSSKTEALKLLNNQPVTSSEFTDIFFEFDKNYIYLVRTVSLGSNAEPIESLDSEPLSFMPKDTFAPSTPTAITIAAAPNSLSMFFAANPEKDIAGYRIYRSTNQELPKTEWQLLTKELLMTNTFQDKQVESGKTYYYYIIAIDKAGNISQPSDIVSETAP